MTAQQYALSTLASHELAEIGARIRRCADAASFDQIARAIVDTLWGALIERVPPQLAMLRLYRVRTTGSLEPALRALVPDAPPRALVLAASRGLELSWNDATASQRHRVIALSDPSPMVTKLVGDLALDRAGDPGVFFVAEAIGSPIIPSQEPFVLRYGVRSVIATGGAAVGFALIAFSRVALSPDLVRGFGDLGLCAGFALSHASDLDGPHEATLEARAHALAQLLDREEPVLIQRLVELERDHDQLRATHAQHLREVAADAAASAKRQERSQRAMLNVIEDLREARAGLERRVDERTAELRQRNDELASTNAELEQFAYVASHDLQEPLRMVASYNQLLARRYKGKLDKDADDFIGFSVEGVTRMQRLINDLLAYSRVGTRGGERVDVDLAEVLGHVRSNLERAIADTSAIITNDPLPHVQADEGQMLQLLQNLVGNAIKFHGDEAPAVHVGVKPDGQTFFIKDNGIGIDPQFFDRIFVIFQRLNPREKYPGTGIGLAICKKIVERHGGRMWVESEPGKGSTMLFTLGPTSRRLS